MHATTRPASGMEPSAPPGRTVRLAVPGAAAPSVPLPAGAQPVTPRVTLADPRIGDQDDICIWVHASVRGRSTIITSDKAVNKLFVYDLAGSTVQVVPTPGKPGN